jgi:hypothetical protein
LVHDITEILKPAANYYKDLFRWEDRGGVSLDENFWTRDEMVSNAENLELESPFIE